MKHKKGSKLRKPPKRKLTKRKLTKPRATKARGTASGARKVPKMRKRPTAKKATKKKKTVTRKSRTTVKRRTGRAAGFVDTLRSAKDRLGRFYDENKDALKVAAALATTAGLGYGAYRLADERNSPHGWETWEALSPRLKEKRDLENFARARAAAVSRAEMAEADEMLKGSARRETVQLMRGLDEKIRQQEEEDAYYRAAAAAAATAAIKRQRR
jgi:hypothetical protein